ncbi:MAG: hypothetical protein Q8L48_05460 [Archangium sp.]|nr:hypothetical protein [Archangium sp.]
MRRGLLLLGALTSAVALADELPSNACFGDLAKGDACLTDDGTSGTCVEQVHSYVDQGQTHTYSELICVPAVSGAERRALPWMGAGLAFLALCVGIATRKPPVQSPA